MRLDRFDELMESGALALGAQAVADERLEPGCMVSHYRIVEEIGHGGMGVVYRAFDTKLEREVALKILLMGHRLWREARAAASLKHPNIGVVYEIGEADDVTYLAMELLEGESLSQRLKREKLDPSKALTIATGVAEGLAHAHERGIVHRDLKPANIMLTDHGPKIIDFGLAGDEDGHAPMGTPGYAAPEQMRGGQVDARSDIYSFGVLLKEILDNGVWRFRRVADRCLATDPKDRYQTAGEMNDELRRVSSTRRKWPWVAAFIAAIAAAVVLRPPPTSIELTNAIQITSDVGVEEHARWSPDGQTLAYDANLTGEWHIWLTRIDGRPFNRTADFDGAARFPSWSPDGSQLAFWSARGSGDGGVIVMPTTAGAPQRVATADTPAAPQWSRDGSRLLFVNGTHAQVVALGEGTSESIELPGQSTHRFDLSWSRDERYLAYIDANAAVDEVTRLWVLRVSDKTSFQLTDGQTNVWSPSWSADSDTLYFVSNRGGEMDLWQQRFGSGRDGPDGAPEQLTVGIGVRNAAFSEDGRKLVYSKGRRVANVWRVPLGVRPAGWRDAEQLTFDQALIEFADVSPDGQSLVVSSDRTGNQDLWLLPADGGDLAQLTKERTPDWSPVWSPDGSAIAFYAYRGGNRDIWLIPESGGAARQVTRDPAEDYRMAFSPDGRELVFDSTRSGSWDIWSFDLEDETARQLTTHPAIDSDARFSPDGSRLCSARCAREATACGRFRAAVASRDNCRKAQGEIPASRRTAVTSSSLVMRSELETFGGSTWRAATKWP